MSKKKFPVLPANPHRLCWGCDKYCPSDAMQCGNGSDRTQHPSELFGEDWQSWGGDFVPDADKAASAATPVTDPTAPP